MKFKSRAVYDPKEVAMALSKKVSLAAIAAEVDVSSETIRRIKSGKANPNYETARAIQAMADRLLK